MPNQELGLDNLFRALADPTRRAVIARLADGPAAMSELARPFEMAPPSFLQHMRVLEGAGLVASRKSGRVRTYRLEARPLRSVETWLGAQRATWEKRLDQLDAYLQAEKENDA